MGGPVQHSKGSVGDPTDPMAPAGIEPPPSRQAPGALPFEQLPSKVSLIPPQGIAVQHTHPHHMQAPWRRPAFPPLYGCMLTSAKAGTHWGF